MTVDEMLQRMSAEEFGRWMAFYELRPFGPGRAPEPETPQEAASSVYESLKASLMMMSGANHA